MKFNQAYPYMKSRGYRAKLPEWGGYWYWSHGEDTLRIYTKHGEDFDIRETNDVDYTLQFIVHRDDWEIFTPE